MILIKIADAESKRKALAFLAGRFSFKSWANRDLVVPEDALPDLALEGVRFSVEGPVPYEKLVSAPLRDTAASSIQ